MKHVKVWGSLLACGMLAVAVGCTWKDEVKEADKVAKEKAAKETKAAFVKPFTDELPKIEEKIKTLTGITATSAKEKFDAVKKLLDEYNAAPADKLKDLGEKLKTAFEDLKKTAGV